MVFLIEESRIEIKTVSTFAVTYFGSGKTEGPKSELAMAIAKNLLCYRADHVFVLFCAYIYYNINSCSRLSDQGCAPTPLEERIPFIYLFFCVIIRYLERVRITLTAASIESSMDVLSRFFVYFANVKEMRPNCSMRKAKIIDNAPITASR